MTFNFNLDNSIVQENALDKLKRYSNEPRGEHAQDYYTNIRDRTYLGTPVFHPLEIKGGTYKDEKGQDVSYEGMFFDTVLFTISQNKVMEKTQVSGSKGTIVEYISDGDFAVNIKIILNGKGNAFPKESAQRLIAILRAPAPLEVVCERLNIYQIFSLVVESYSDPQRQGFQNQFAVDIQCTAHEPLDLRLINEQ